MTLAESIAPTDRKPSAHSLGNSTRQRSCVEVAPPPTNGSRAKQSFASNRAGAPMRGAVDAGARPRGREREAYFKQGNCYSMSDNKQHEQRDLPKGEQRANESPRAPSVGAC